LLKLQAILLEANSIKYLKNNKAPTVTQPAGPQNKDELQGLDAGKLFDSLGKALEASAKLAKALNEARPVAIAALMTILFLLGWLFSLSLLIVGALHQSQ
jgi:hypothetical protein